MRAVSDLRIEVGVVLPQGQTLIPRMHNWNAELSHHW